MKITPETLDKKCLTRALAAMTGGWAPSQIICAYLNALLESGKARITEDFKYNWTDDWKADRFDRVSILSIRLEDKP